MPRESFKIQLDPILFQQVILNLIDNAVKFIAAFDKEVIVSLVRKGNEACLFEVRIKVLA